MIHIQVDGWLVTMFAVVLWIWLAAATVDAVLKARAEHWKKELSKTIARNVAAGIPTKVFVSTPAPEGENDE